MKIAISSKNNQIDAPFASSAHDASYLLIIDSETLGYRVISNSKRHYLQLRNTSVLKELVDHEVEILVCGKTSDVVIEDLYRIKI